MSENEQHFGDDRDGFSHGLDEEDSMTADVKPEESDEVAEEDKQVNDPDVDTRPAEPVQHTSNVVGRRNPALPTSAPRGTVPAPGTAI
jgi:hypothetical protein